MTKIGVLLINLGTPDNCDNRSVYRYLKEFLNDPRVIDISAILRWVLINLIIVPLRHKKSAAAYQKIWLTDGSPLLVYSKNIGKKLQIELGENFQVVLAMRYGRPSLQVAIDQLQDCKQIIVVPLFPQYSAAATGSALEKMFTLIKKQWNIPAITVINEFYDNPGFIAACTKVIQKNLEDKSIDYLLFSYHGLPERHINKSACQADCNRVNSCPPVNVKSQFCYRAQCYATSRAIFNSLNKEGLKYDVAFQSRLGKTPWIKPYTDLLLPKLINEGVKRLAVVCPSFIADCLETLEEVNIRLREQWLELGGEEFVFIPCINDHPTWIKALAELVKNYC